MFDKNKVDGDKAIPGIRDSIYSTTTLVSSFSKRLGLVHIPKILSGEYPGIAFISYPGTVKAMKIAFDSQTLEGLIPPNMIEYKPLTTLNPALLSKVAELEAVYIGRTGHTQEDFNLMGKELTTKVGDLGILIPPTFGRIYYLKARKGENCG